MLSVDGSPEGLPLIRCPRRESFMGLRLPKRPPECRQAPTCRQRILPRPPAHRGLTLLESRRPHRPLSGPCLPRLA